MRDWSLFIGLTSLIVASLGCSDQDNDRIAAYPVTGKVLVKGQPADGASIIFYSQSPAPEGKKMPVPAGSTDANGSFQLTSYESGDGAPATDYNVAIIWPEPPPPNAIGVFEPQDRLRGRYANPQTAVRASIAAPTWRVKCHHAPSC
jgi:hypothetical protein